MSDLPRSICLCGRESEGSRCTCHDGQPSSTPNWTHQDLVVFTPGFQGILPYPLPWFVSEPPSASSCQRQSNFIPPSPVDCQCSGAGTCPSCTTSGQGQFITTGSDPLLQTQSPVALLGESSSSAAAHSLSAPNPNLDPDQNQLVPVDMFNHDSTMRRSEHGILAQARRIARSMANTVQRIFQHHTSLSSNGRRSGSGGAGRDGGGGLRDRFFRRFRR
ncbi:hypothetical protein FRB91_003588 [Serendipita sp. 411]|nr:hypothetical protein FRB91_003588 [Serendipita sp. 411]